VTTYATVADVSTTNVGDNLIVAALTGATYLEVSNATIFDERGGQILIGDVLYSYTGVDTVLNRVLLTTPLLADAPDDTRVSLYPLHPVKVAMVEFGIPETDAVPIQVPHTLKDTLLDGVRVPGQGEQVLLEDRDGSLYLQDIMATPVQVLYGDGIPPIASPTPVVDGFVGALHAKWAAISGPDPISYQVHVSTVSGFTPDLVSSGYQLQDGSGNLRLEDNSGYFLTEPVTFSPTLVGTTTATSFTIRTLPNDTLLNYDTVYYVKIVAYDYDGPAPAGDQGSASLVKITGDDIAVNYVYAGEVNAAQITGGEIHADLTISGSIKTAETGGRTEIDPGGVAIYDPAGTPQTVLAPDQSVFKGDAEIGGLTVTDAMSVRGVNNELAASAQLRLASGITAPTTAPTIVQDWETITFTKPGDASFVGSGLTSVCKVGTLWVCGYKKPGTNEYYVYRFNADGTFNSEATPMIISSTIAQTTQLIAGGRCYSVASNGTLFKHRLLTDTIMFSDPFTSGIDTTRWPDRSHESWSSGAAYLESTDTIDTAYIATAQNKNIKGAYLQAEWIEDNTANDGHEALMQILHSNGNVMAEIFIKGDVGTGRTLYCRQWDPYTDSSSGTFSMTYSPTTHRWWKIEEGGDGRFYFYTSSDGSSWTLRYDNPHTVTDPDMAATKFMFMATDHGLDNVLAYYVDNVEHGVINSSASFTYPRTNTSQTPTIGNDGTNLLVGEYDDAVGRYVVKVVDPATMAVTATIPMALVSNATGPVAGVLKGNFDIGSSRYIFKDVGALEWKVYLAAGGTGSAQNGEYFWADSGGSKSIVWDGSNFWALGTNGKLYKHTSVGAGTGVTTGSSLPGFKVAYTWYDSNATGGTHETTKSPDATFTLLKRARLTVSAPNIPGGAGTDDPNGIAIYAGSAASPATLTLQAVSGIGIHSMVFNSLVTGGAAPPGANNFPSALPAKILFGSSELSANGDVKVAGVLTAANRIVGVASITPVANTPTSLNVTFPTALTGTTFFGVCTPGTSAPGTLVMGVGITNVTSTGCTLWIYRTNVTPTSVFFIVEGV
jgi:hypothetical protein